jgi:SpoU rRNA methylase family enzyme
VSNWTLRDASGVEKPAAGWGLGELTRSRLNQAADLVTFRAAELDSDADPVFAFGSTVRVFQDGAPWFYGRVVQAPGRATGTGEDQLYRLAGPWWYLENLVFQQIWELTSGTSISLGGVAKSRIILTQAADGTKMATGAAILEVLNYAIEQGAPFTIGAVTPNALAPYAEVLDESCAAVLHHLLRWTPDAIAAFDYSTAGLPVLSIVQRTSATSVTLPAYGAPVSGLELTPRYDLQAPCVQIKYEQTNDIDGDSYTSLTVDTTPAGATGAELSALVMTVNLAGARATYHSQAITTGPIPTGDAASSAVTWWQGKHPWLADFAAGDLTVVSGTQSITVDGSGETPASDYPNELLSGSLSPWMNFLSSPLRVSATLQYTGTATAESADVFGTSNQRVVYTRVIGTNANSGTYKQLTSATDAEPVPIGLAEALYAAVSVLQYDGALELTEEECSGSVSPGQLLNLSGGRPEWAAMEAQVQRVEEQVATGVTQITVGPAKHLRQADLQALLHVNRARRQSYRRSERTTGEAKGDAAQVIGGEQQPRSDSLVRPSGSGAAAAPNFPYALIDGSTSAGLSLSVNVNSFLLQSLTPNDLFSITGLGTPIAASAGMMVWLEVDFASDGATVSTASIGSGSGGWTGFPMPFAYTGESPNQVLASAFVLIGYIAAAGSPLDGRTISGGTGDSAATAKIIQCVTQHLLLRTGVFNGQAMIFPFPHHGPDKT